MKCQAKDVVRKDCIPVTCTLVRGHAGAHQDGRLRWTDPVSTVERTGR